MKELKEIRICDLKPFEEHPYKVLDNEEMDALAESIREHGIMTPLIVRRVGNGYIESNFKQDTRQGVAVEYVPHAAGE